MMTDNKVWDLGTRNKDVFSWYLSSISFVMTLIAVRLFLSKQFYNTALFFLMFVFGINIAICLLNLKKRIIFLFFNFTIFLFLISRILVPALKGWQWWIFYSLKANVFAVIAISLSLSFLSLGMLVMEKVLEKRHYKEEINSKWIDRKCLMQVLRLVLAVCMLCFFIVEAEKLIFMYGKPYEEYYVSYQTSVPFLVYFPAGCMNYFLCAFLALLPSKKESFIWLSLYVISAVPMLIIGARNPIILRCIFAFLYYFLRDALGRSGDVKWIGKVERRLVICAIPLIIVFLGAYNYIRSNDEVKMSLPELVVDFCYKQGTTYDTVLQGYIYEDDLPKKDEKIYTLGALQEEVLYNTLGRIVFNTDDIGSGNSEKRAIEGKVFSHAISYVVMKDKYLAGEGRGSSYIIENYVDWGYLGIAIFSMFLGGVCSWIACSFGKRWFTTVIGLMMLTNLFFTPRAEATAFLCFLVSYKFWMCMGGICVLQFVWKILNEKYMINNRLFTKK